MLHIFASYVFASYVFAKMYTFSNLDKQMDLDALLHDSMTSENINQMYYYHTNFEEAVSNDLIEHVKRF